MSGRLPAALSKRAAVTGAAVLLLGILAHPLAPDIRDGWELAVALGGMLLPLNWAVGAAVAVPALNTVLWGAPYLTTDLPLLVCQMMALAALANFFYGMMGWNVYASLLAAMSLSLVVLFCAASVFGAVSSGLIRALPYVRSTCAADWPVMLIEIVLVPPAALIARRIQEVRS